MALLFIYIGKTLANEKKHQNKLKKTQKVKQVNCGGLTMWSNLVENIFSIFIK